MVREKKHRFVILIEKENFEKFKELAEKQNRSASNLGSIVIKEYIERNYKN